MKKYCCNPCKFKSNNKYDYTRHIESNRHSTIIAEEEEEALALAIDVPAVFECHKCGNVYLSQSSRTKHMNKCNAENNENLLKQGEFNIIELNLTREKVLLLEKSVEDKNILYSKILKEKEILENKYKNIKDSQTIKYLTFISNNYTDTKHLKGYTNLWYLYTFPIISLLSNQIHNILK